MKLKHILSIAGISFLLYSFCTVSGAIKLQALLISYDPSVYLSGVEKLSILGDEYYALTKVINAHETGNSLGAFSCKRTFLFISCSYVGMP